VQVDHRGGETAVPQQSAEQEKVSGAYLVVWAVFCLGL
jgi:hypothetical protein